MYVVLQDHRVALGNGFEVVNLSWVNRGFVPIRLPVRFISLQGFRLRILRMAFQRATRCVGFLRTSFFLYLARLRGRISEFLFNVTGGTAHVSGNGFSLQVITIVYRLMSVDFRLLRRLFKVCRVFQTSWDGCVSYVLSRFSIIRPGGRSAGSQQQGVYESSVPSPEPVCLAKVLG